MKLEEIEKLCNEATPGLWLKDETDYGDWTGSRLKSLGPIKFWASCADDSSLDINDADAKFIAASRELIPKLLLAVRSLESIVVTYENMVALNTQGRNYCFDFSPLMENARLKLKDLEDL